MLNVPPLVAYLHPAAEALFETYINKQKRRREWNFLLDLQINKAIQTRQLERKAPFRTLTISVHPLGVGGSVCTNPKGDATVARTALMSAYDLKQGMALNRFLVSWNGVPISFTHAATYNTCKICG